MARLDRFLFMDERDTHFGGATQSILPKPISNHLLILLEGGGSLNKGPLPLRLKNMWCKAEGFKDLINEWWKSLEYSGSSSYVLMEKLKALKFRLRNWNKDVFGRVEERK